MFDQFDDLEDFLNVAKICSDNNVCKLHYRFTGLFLFGFTVLVGCSEYLGDPIDCTETDGIPENVLETYCWAHSTFTLPDAFDKEIGVEIAHPGVDKYTPGENRRYHSYYQWVVFVLFLQALSFYMPRKVWKLLDSGKLEDLVMELNCGVLKPEDRSVSKILLVEYLKTHIDSHNEYLMWFTLFETYNFLNVLGQIYFMDIFFGGGFTTFGIDIIRFTNYDQESRSDPMIKVFPRMTKCTFHSFGSSGDVQKHDALCILPLNVFYEKVYVFLWFWFVILATLSAGMLVFRFVTILWPASRLFMLRHRCVILDKKDLHVVLSHIKIGDWFLLYLLSKNVDSVYFREIIHDFAIELKEGEKLTNKCALEDYKSIP